MVDIYRAKRREVWRERENEEEMGRRAEKKDSLIFQHFIADVNPNVEHLTTPFSLCICTCSMLLIKCITTQLRYISKHPFCSIAAHAFMHQRCSACNRYDAIKPVTSSPAVQRIPCSQLYEMPFPSCTKTRCPSR